MTIKNILNLAFLLIVANTFGQEYNSDFSEFKKRLLESNIDLIVEYKSDCFGTVSIDLENDCISENAIYLFWEEDGNYFKNKFSKCGISGRVKMDRPDLLMKIKQNIESIKNAEILPVEHTGRNSDGKIEIVQLELDHYCQSKFTIKSNNQKMEKIINEFYLETDMIDENTPNDNFKSNQNSILNKLIRLVNIEIE